MNQIKLSLKEEIVPQKLLQIIKNGGPYPEEYKNLDLIIYELGKNIETNKINSDYVNELKKQCNFLNDETSIMGHIRLKPFGYSGDYSIIDRIYTKKYSEKYYKWDCYSLNHSGAVAVRNRKKYFNSLMTHFLKSGGKLLNIASGPARGLYEFYNENPDIKVTTTCVEMDPRAIKFSRILNVNHLKKITFIKKNVFRYHTTDKFNIIWSAGLFDYFDDKAFVVLLKRFTSWLKPNGQIVIGNFNKDHNPSRVYMELFGEWYLNHRTENQLIYLAKKAGLKNNEIHVGREPENVNLFLHIIPK